MQDKQGSKLNLFLQDKKPAFLASMLYFLATLVPPPLIISPPPMLSLILTSLFIHFP